VIFPSLLQSGHAQLPPAGRSRGAARRRATADAAVAAAGKILATAAKGQVAEDLLARGIEDVRKRFN